MVGFLGITAAFEKEQESFVPGSATAVEDTPNPRADVAPDFAPDFAGRLAECPGMLLAEGYAAVGVVVEKREIGSPAHPHRETGGEQDRTTVCRLWGHVSTDPSGVDASRPDP